MADKRRRLDAATARELILDAAEKRLVVVGPSGIRLQEVAADAGVSHPTVLHHFGSREGLVKAVIARSMASIHEGLVNAIQASTGEEGALAKIFDSVHEALKEGGRGRVVLWLSLEGHRLDDAEGARLADVVDAAHALRTGKMHAKKARTPPREDTAFTVILASLALAGASALGAPFFASAGVADDEATGARFRTWLARLLVEHLDTPAGTRRSRP